MSVHFTLIVCC